MQAHAWSSFGGRLGSGDRRRLGQQVLDLAVDLLLLLDPLRGAAQRGGDLVDPLRTRSPGRSVSTACSRISSTCSWMRVSSASRKASLSRASRLLGQPLLEDLELAGEALAQVLAERLRP